MTMKTSLLAVLMTLAICLPVASADSIARVPVKDMFAAADIVAYLQIREGRVAGSGYAVYTAVVTEAFKGASENDTIVLGPYRGYAVGGDYLAFLQRPVDKQDETSDLGRYCRIQRQGMGMMVLTYVVDYNEYGVNVESGALVPAELERSTIRGYVNKVDLAAYLRSLPASGSANPAPN